MYKEVNTQVRLGLCKRSGPDRRRLYAQVRPRAGTKPEAEGLAPVGIVAQAVPERTQAGGS